MSSELSLPHCEALLHKLRSSSSASLQMKLANELDRLHLQYRNSGSKDEKFAKFFEVWAEKGEKYPRKLSEGTGNSMELEEEKKPKGNVEEQVVELEERDIEDEMISSRREANLMLRSTGQKMKAFNSALAEQNEQILASSHQLDQALSSLRSGNKQLAQATRADADSAALKLEMSGSAAGAVGGTVVAPGIGSIFGLVIGNRIGNFFGKKIVDKTESNIKKLGD